MKLLIKNGLILDESGKSFKRDIYITNGIINRIADEINEDIVETLDAMGNYILPGFIDLNCSMCDSGYENIEDISTVARAAAKGGFTSITCSPLTQPVIDDKTIVNYIISRSKKISKVNIFPYGSMTKGCLGEEIAEIGDMHNAGVIGISDGNQGVFHTDLLRNIFLYSNMFEIPVITFCMDARLVGNGVVNDGEIATEMGLSVVPIEAEEVSVARNLILAKHTGANLHLTHISTKGSVEIIRFAKEMGIKVTCDTCPHYLTLSEEAVKGYNTYAKVNPPLRTADDIKILKQAIKDGIIDAISTGHSPTSHEYKQLEFDRAAMGISSLETAFALCYTTLVDTGLIQFHELINLMSYKPANILGLANKGQIKEGYDADLIIASVNEEFEINPKEFASRAKFSPHEGARVKGKVLYTIVNGSIIYLY